MFSREDVRGGGTGSGVAPDPHAKKIGPLLPERTVNFFLHEQQRQRAALCCGGAAPASRFSRSKNSSMNAPRSSAIFFPDAVSIFCGR